MQVIKHSAGQFVSLSLNLKHLPSQLVILSHIRGIHEIVYRHTQCLCREIYLAELKATVSRQHLGYRSPADVKHFGHVLLAHAGEIHVSLDVVADRPFDIVGFSFVHQVVVGIHRFLCTHNAPSIIFVLGN